MGLLLLDRGTRAAEGNVGAFSAYMKYLAKYEPQGTHPNGGYLVVSATMTNDEFIRATEKDSAEADARHAARYREYALMAGRSIP